MYPENGSHLLIKKHNYVGPKKLTTCIERQMKFHENNNYYVRDLHNWDKYMRHSVYNQCTTSPTQGMSKLQCTLGGNTFCLETQDDSYYNSISHTNRSSLNVFGKLADFTLQVLQDTGWLFCSLRNCHNLDHLCCRLSIPWGTTHKLHSSKHSSTTWHEDTIVLQSHAFTAALVRGSLAPSIMSSALAAFMHMFKTASWRHQQSIWLKITH